MWESRKIMAGGGGEIAATTAVRKGFRHRGGETD